VPEPEQGRLELVRIDPRKWLLVGFRLWLPGQPGCSPRCSRGSLLADGTRTVADPSLDGGLIRRIRMTVRLIIR
jgi:hypothetical protein